MNCIQLWLWRVDWHPYQDDIRNRSVGYILVVVTRDSAWAVVRVVKPDGRAACIARVSGGRALVAGSWRSRVVGVSRQVVQPTRRTFVLRHFTSHQCRMMSSVSRLLLLLTLRLWTAALLWCPTTAACYLSRSVICHLHTVTHPSSSSSLSSQVFISHASRYWHQAYSLVLSHEALFAIINDST